MVQEISQFLWIFELLSLRMVSSKMRTLVDQIIQFTQSRDLRVLFTPQTHSSHSSSVLSLSDDGADSQQPAESAFNLHQV